MTTIPRLDLLLKATGVLLVILAGPLVARDALLREFVPPNPCAGTATESSPGNGNWSISGCVGGCGGSVSCSVQHSGNTSWCGCPDVPEWNCCHVKVVSGNVDKDGDCISCGLMGACYLSPGASKTAMCSITPPQ